MARIDPDTEHFELDFGGSRFTHQPSGDTCLRQNWMTGPKWDQWETMFKAFLGRHPDCHTVTDTKGNIVDDIRRSPLAGGGFASGETVVVMDRSTGNPEWALLIVGTSHHGSQAWDPYPGDVPISHLLENGETLSWDQHSHGWTTRSRSQDAVVRVRPMLPMENVDDLICPSGTIMRDAIPHISKRLLSVGHGFRIERLFPDDHMLASYMAADMVSIANGMQRSFMDLNVDPFDHDKLMTAAEHFENAATIVSEIAAMPLAEKAYILNHDDGLGDLVTKMPTLVASMRRRGIFGIRSMRVEPETEAMVPGF
jgi:hypothetical protein